MPKADEGEGEELPLEGLTAEQTAILGAAQQRTIAVCEADFKENPSAANRRQWQEARGVVSALDVLEAPLPILQRKAVHISTTQASCAQCSQRPAEVKLWELIPHDIARALQCLREVELQPNHIPSLSGQKILRRNTEFVSNMDFDYWAGEVISCVLAAAARPEFITSLPGPTNHNGNPDWEVDSGLAPQDSDDGRAIMLGEGKSAAAMRDVPDDLVGHYNTVHQGDLFNCIVPQLYGYLLSNELRYGWLTTYERTWFVKAVGDVLFVSPVVKSSDVNPSVRQMLYWLVLQTDTQNPRPKPCPPSRAAGAVCSPGSSTPYGEDGRQPACLTHLGYKLLPDDAVVVNRPLGEGAIGIVRAGSVYGHEAALKMADAHSAKPDVKLLQHEAGVYAAMPHLQGDVVPILVEYGYINGGNSFLLATNVVHGEHPSAACVRSPKQRASAFKGLRAIHAAGFLHGDVRSDNIVLERGSEKAVFLDLAFSRRGASRAERAAEMRQLRLTTRLCAVAAAMPRQSRMAGGRRIGW